MKLVVSRTLLRTNARIHARSNAGEIDCTDVPRPSRFTCAKVWLARLLGLVVVVQQILRTLLLLLRNIQLTEENSLPGIFMTLIVRMPDLKLFFWPPFC